MKRLLQGIVLCCACWLLPATATAQNLQAVSAWGILAYHDGFGIGARYLMPLGTTGLIQGAAVKDRFGLELWADFIDWSDSYHTYDYNYAALLPMVGVIWTFWLNPELALYPKIDLGYAIGWYRDWDNDWGHEPDEVHGGFFWQFSAGIIYRLKGNVALRAELGNSLLKLGAGFGF